MYIFLPRTRFIPSSDRDVYVIESERSFEVLIT